MQILLNRWHIQIFRTYIKALAAKKVLTKNCFSKEYLEDPAASFTADEVEELLNMKPQEAEVKAAELEERLYNGYNDIDYSETYYDEATTEVAEGSSSTLQVLTNDVLTRRER